MKNLEIKTSLQILKPVEDVFEAISESEKMSNYFISESSSSMQEGKEIEWKFPEFEGSFFIKVLKIEKPTLIIFEWEGLENQKTKVQFRLEEVEASNTVVHITEAEMPVNDAGITWYGQNTGGWANFLASLKAYLEYGINLRKGAFDFMKNQT